MPDFRVADTAAEHPKMRAAGLPAFGLWTAAGAWCMNPAHLTDGWVPAYYVASWPAGKRLAATLVNVGLWRPEKRDGMVGWQFHDWTDIQRSAEQIALEKVTNAARRELYGSPKLVAAIKGRDANRCRYCGRIVSWTDRRGTGGATFDLVLPIAQGGRNDLVNVVVACRGCSASKGTRTPEQAGMRLLPAPSTPDRNQNGSSSGVKTEPDEYSAPHPHPHPSSGDLGGEGPVSSRAARAQRPPERCPKHVNDADAPPCGACREARQRAEKFDRQQTISASSARSSEARQRADDRARQIAACRLCDSDGYVGGQLCNHDPDAPARAARGRAQVAEALAGKQAAS